MKFTRQADPRGQMRSKVLQTIKVHGLLTDDAVAKHLETHSNNVRPRRLELQRRGVVREAGKHKTRSDRWATAWKAVA